MQDSYGREISYLRLSVTDRCNLRCRYCMPPEGVCQKRHEEMLTEDELITAVQAAASLGLHKLRITGGEPLVKKNILSICRRAAQVEGIDEVCLTTNGALLPSLAKPLREAGVARLNISLDTLDREKYAYITRRGALEEALAGIESALEAGFQRLKLNVVLIGGFNEDEIPALAALTYRWPVDVRFIELMPMGAGGAGGFLPAEAVRKLLPQLRPCGLGSVSSLYRLPDALGTVGLIAPLSHAFCARCDRIRVTADGTLKPCLHSALEIPLRGLHGAALENAIRAGIAAKPARHHLDSGRTEAARSMDRIGG